MPPRWTNAAFGALILIAVSHVQTSRAFDMSQNNNLAVYWGQASGGNSPLSEVCQDDTIDTIPLAFLAAYTGSDGPSSARFNLGSTCNPADGGCASLGKDIKACQDKGKLITLSIGGGVANIAISSDAEAKTFGEYIYNTYLGGNLNDKNRPLGNAVLDGIDLDIEGGSTQYFATFVNHMWDYASEKGDKRKYYLTAAPQCPYPDAYMQDVLNAASFDALYIQFYNNDCGLNNPDRFNFDKWQDWATRKSQNKNVKLYIGAPGSPSKAGQGYVDAKTLGNFVKETREKYPSFGGVMLWESKAAKVNGDYSKQVKELLGGSSSGPSVDPAPPSEPVEPVEQGPDDVEDDDHKEGAPAGTPSGDGCGCIEAWDSDTVYVKDDEVTYNGRIFSANWWTKDEEPTGVQWTVWTDEGPCQ